MNIEVYLEIINGGGSIAGHRAFICQKWTDATDFAEGIRDLDKFLGRDSQFYNVNVSVFDNTDYDPNDLLVGKQILLWQHGEHGLDLERPYVYKGHVNE